jgi:hypothetical protein
MVARCALPSVEGAIRQAREARAAAFFCRSRRDGAINPALPLPRQASVNRIVAEIAAKSILAPHEIMDELNAL